MAKSDVFIIEDNIHFEWQGFTNRNKIKTVDGVRWLTVPAEHAGRSLLINQVKIANRAEPDWAERHWLTLKSNYCKAPFWKDYCDFFEQTYRREWTKLIDLNLHLIRGLMNFLGINTPLVLASSLGVKGKKSELVLAQCKRVGSTVHFAGTGARDYLNVEQFRKEGIEVVFQDFQHPHYAQLWGDFVPNLAAIDYLFCTGGKISDQQRLQLVDTKST